MILFDNADEIPYITLFRDNNVHASRHKRREGPEMLYLLLSVLRPGADRGRNQLKSTTWNGLLQPTVGREFCGGFYFLEAGFSDLSGQRISAIAFFQALTSNCGMLRFVQHDRFSDFSQFLREETHEDDHAFVAVNSSSRSGC